MTAEGEGVSVAAIETLILRDGEGVDVRLEVAVAVLGAVALLLAVWLDVMLADAVTEPVREVLPVMELVYSCVPEGDTVLDGDPVDVAVWEGVTDAEALFVGVPVDVVVDAAVPEGVELAEAVCEAVMLAVCVGVKDGLAHCVGRIPPLVCGIALRSPEPSAQNMCHRWFSPKPLEGMGAETTACPAHPVASPAPVLVSTLPDA